MSGMAVKTSARMIPLKRSIPFFSASRHSLSSIARTRSISLRPHQLQIDVLQRVPRFTHELDLGAGFHEPAHERRILLFRILEPHDQPTVDGLRVADERQVSR